MDFTAGNGALLRIGLYLLLFWPTVGYYVYQDAKRRGRSNPVALGTGFGFLGVAGLMLYVVRRDHSAE